MTLRLLAERMNECNATHWNGEDLKSMCFGCWDGNQKLNFSHAEFEMPIRCSNGEDKKVVG